MHISDRIQIKIFFHSKKFLKSDSSFKVFSCFNQRIDLFKESFYLMILQAFLTHSVCVLHVGIKYLQELGSYEYSQDNSGESHEQKHHNPHRKHFGTLCKYRPAMKRRKVNEPSQFPKVKCSIARRHLKPCSLVLSIFPYPPIYCIASNALNITQFSQI